MFERRKQPLLPLTAFLQRLLYCSLFGLLVVTSTLSIGTAGFHYLEGLSLIDSFLNASMFFGGLGTAFPITTDEGKLFASLYAVCCPFSLVTAVSFLLMPFVHRFFHKFHLEN